MTQEKIIEGNKLIAEFLGYKPSKVFTGYSERFRVTCELVKYKNGLFTDNLNFHSSWNWLMPVVEKVESIKDAHHGRFGVHIVSNSCIIQATKFRSDKPLANPPHYFTDCTLDSKIESTLTACINFIKWYNETKGS